MRKQQRQWEYLRRSWSLSKVIRRKSKYKGLQIKKDRYTDFVVPNIILTHGTYKNDTKKDQNIEGAVTSQCKVTRHEHQDKRTFDWSEGQLEREKRKRFSHTR